MNMGAGHSRDIGNKVQRQLGRMVRAQQAVRFLKGIGELRVTEHAIETHHLGQFDIGPQGVIFGRREQDIDRAQGRVGGEFRPAFHRRR